MTVHQDPLHPLVGHRHRGELLRCQLEGQGDARPKGTSKDGSELAHYRDQLALAVKGGAGAGAEQALQGLKLLRRSARRGVHHGQGAPGIRGDEVSGAGIAGREDDGQQVARVVREGCCGAGGDTLIEAGSAGHGAASSTWDRT